MANRTQTSEHELLTKDNLACSIKTALRDLIGCGCDDWHYMRLWQNDDGCYYTDGIELGSGISPSYPSSPFEGGGIDPRQTTVTLPCCDCHNVNDCNCDPDDCPCAHCGCGCHEDDRASALAQEAMESIREEAE